MTQEPIIWKWHELEDGFGGYASARVGSGENIQIITTSVSTDSSEVHFKNLMEKISEERVFHFRWHKPTKPGELSCSCDLCGKPITTEDKYPTRIEQNGKEVIFHEDCGTIVRNGNYRIA